MRAGKKEDFPAIAALSMRCFPAQEAWSLTTLEASDTQSIRSFVAFLKQNIHGFCLFQLALDEANLLSLAVSPDYQKRGIGSALLTQSLNILEKDGMKSTILEVRAQNQSAIRLYHRLGFRQQAIRKAYYPKIQSAEKEDAVVMRRLSPCRVMDTL